MLLGAILLLNTNSGLFATSSKPMLEDQELLQAAIKASLVTSKQEAKTTPYHKQKLLAPTTAAKASKMHASRFCCLRVKPISKAGGVHQFPNYGNWCYFNATLQAFFSNPTINTQIERISEKATTSTTGGCLKAMQLAAQTHGSLPVILHQKSFATITDILFEGSEEQQDASELTVRLLDKMSCFSKAFPKGTRTKTFFCDTCGTVVKPKEEVFSTIEIPYQTRTRSSIGEELAKISVPEATTRGNEVSCKHCKTKRAGHNIVSIAPSKDLLIIRLTREGWNKATQTAYKNRNPIAVEENTTLEGNDYTLSGMVLHRGASAKSGHYIAIVRNNSDRWVIADDSRISDGTAAQAAIARGEKYADFDVTMAFYSESNSTAAREGGASGAQYAGAGAGAGSY